MPILPNWKSAYHTKNVDVNQAGWPSCLRRQTQEIPQLRILVHECVRGFESTPVRKRFEHDEAEPSAHKFCHTGTLIEDDSPKQKTKKSQRRLWLITERLQTAQKKDTQTRYVKHECTHGFKSKSSQMDDTNHLAD